VKDIKEMFHIFLIFLIFQNKIISSKPTIKNVFSPGIFTTVRQQDKTPLKQSAEYFVVLFPYSRFINLERISYYFHRANYKPRNQLILMS